MRGLIRFTGMISIVALVGLVPLPAEAGVGVTIRALDTPNRFDPDIVYGLTTSPDDPAGNHPIRWRNDGELDHQVVEHPNQDGIRLRTAVLSPGETSARHELHIAAVWKYICKIHGPDMDGFIKVRPALYQRSDPGDYPVTQDASGRAILRMANGALPDNYLLDVQRRRGDGAWGTVREGLTTNTTIVSPNRPGVYQFRSRIRHSVSGSETAWSPPSKKLTITG